MPKYSFECQECQVRFERNLKMGEHTTHPCPSCKDPAPRLFDGEGFAFGFGQGGTAVANSGVHDHDYPTADKAVGRSAEARWDLISKRDQVKNEARKQGGTHALIRHTGDSYIDYEPMSQTGRDARKALAKAALKASKDGQGPSQ